MVFSPDTTTAGFLPPFEVAKAYAFFVALTQIEATLGKPSRVLLGKRKSAWIARHLQVKGGGAPSERAVRDAVKRSLQPGWYPGKDHAKPTGRPPVYTEAQKNRVAQTAMALKRKLVRPTPAHVRAKMPRRCLNPDTGEAMSKSTIYRIYVTRCFDEHRFHVALCDPMSCSSSQ